MPTSTNPTTTPEPRAPAAPTLTTAQAVELATWWLDGDEPSEPIADDVWVEVTALGGLSFALARTILAWAPVVQERLAEEMPTPVWMAIDTLRVNGFGHTAAELETWWRDGNEL